MAESLNHKPENNNMDYQLGQNISELKPQKKYEDKSKQEGYCDALEKLLKHLGKR